MTASGRQFAFHTAVREAGNHSETDARDNHHLAKVRDESELARRADTFSDPESLLEPLRGMIVRGRRALRQTGPSYQREESKNESDG